MSQYLLLIVIIIFACILINKVSSKLGIPMLLLFIILGMCFGSDGIVKIYFDNYNFAEQTCSIALIFIMFYGGFDTNWKHAKPIAAKSILLSSLGVILTALLTGLFCFFVLHFPLLESFLIGSIISSTDAASVFSILRSKRLNLKYNTASLLELESGSNDPWSYMLTVLVLSIMTNTASGWQIVTMLLAQIIFGVGFGILIAILAYFILKKFRFVSPGFDAIFVLAIALLSYAAPMAVGGNGYLSAYLVGIILGNLPIKEKKSLVHFFDGITGLMQILIFFLLGLLSFPSKLPQTLIPAFLIALFLTFVGRPLAIFAIMAPFKSKLNQMLYVSWGGLRGASSIVFAIMATISTAITENDIFHIVFCIVLFSILLQGSLIPYMAKKMNMIDNSADVFKTFSDYTEEVPVQFIKFVLTANHPWVNTPIKEIILPPNTLVVLLIRQNLQITPNGDTTLFADDILILSATSIEGVNGISLTEMYLHKDSEWIGKSVSEIVMEPNKLIIMIQRRDDVIIPCGRTLLEKDDLLVINQTD